MKRHDVLFGSIVIIAAWQGLALAIQRDILPTLLVVGQLTPCDNERPQQSGA